MTATEPSAELVPPFDLPSELAIDTDIARRVIGEFIRGQLEQAGFERAVLGLSGGIDSAVVGYLVAERSGQAIDSNAERGAEPGFDLVPAEEPSTPIGFGVHGKGAKAAKAAPRAKTGAAAPTEVPARPARSVDPGA